MSNRRAEVVRELYRGWARGDFRAGLEHYAPDIAFTSQFGMETVRATGREAMRQVWRDHLRNWEAWRTGSIEELHELDDQAAVLVISRIEGRGRHSGVEVDKPRAACAFRFEDDKVVWMLATDRLEAAVEALGRPDSGRVASTAERARGVLAALSRGDRDALLAAVHPDVEWRSFFAIGEAGAYRGEAGMDRYLADLADAFEVVRADADDALEFGDVAVLVGRIVFRGKGSGVESAEDAGWMLKFRDGRLVTFRAFRDPQGALEAVGLPAAAPAG